jgi:hypothetical protein
MKGGAKFWRRREANDRFKGGKLGKNRRKGAKDREGGKNRKQGEERTKQQGGFES